MAAKSAPTIAMIGGGSWRQVETEKPAKTQTTRQDTSPSTLFPKPNPCFPSANNCSYRVAYGQEEDRQRGNVLRKCKYSYQAACQKVAAAGDLVNILLTQKEAKLGSEVPVQGRDA